MIIRTASRAQSHTLMITLILIFIVLFSSCRPVPAPTEPPAPLPPTHAAAVTAEPETTEEIAPTPESAADLAAQLVEKPWLLVAFGEASNPAVVEEGTVVTAFCDSAAAFGFERTAKKALSRGFST